MDIGLFFLYGSSSEWLGVRVGETHASSKKQRGVEILTRMAASAMSVALWNSWFCSYMYMSNLLLSSPSSISGALRSIFMNFARNDSGCAGAEDDDDDDDESDDGAPSTCEFCT